MLIPTALFPAPLPKSAADECAAPLAGPSGEMETRAARLPCGGCTGAGGAGLAESAIKTFRPPLLAGHFASPHSRPGPASPDRPFFAAALSAPPFHLRFLLAGPPSPAGELYAP